MTVTRKKGNAKIVFSLAQSLGLSIRFKKMRTLLILTSLFVILSALTTVLCHSKAVFEPMPKTHVCDHEHVVDTSKTTLFENGEGPALQYKVNHEETFSRIAQEQQSVAAKISNYRKRGLNEQAAVEAAADNFQPMRITFITSTMNVDDGRTCLSTGQVIQVGSPASSAVVCSDTVNSNCWETCTAAMVITTEKLQYMTDTLIPQLESLFENAFSTRRLSTDLLINRQPCGNNITLSSDRVNTGIVASEEDLIVLVTIDRKSVV